MQAKLFTKEDYDEIKSWYQKRNLAILPLEFYPKNGFIVKNIAAGFLYKTDSKICLIENYITNPDISSEERNDALNIITKNIIKLAQDEDFSIIMGSSKEKSIVKRSEDNLFKNLGKYDIFYKKI